MLLFDYKATSVFTCFRPPKKCALTVTFLKNPRFRRYFNLGEVLPDKTERSPFSNKNDPTRIRMDDASELSDVCTDLHLNLMIWRLS